MSNLNVNGNDKNFDLKALIKKADTNGDGVINTRYENDELGRLLQGARNSGEIDSKQLEDYKSLFGLETNGAKGAKPSKGANGADGAGDSKGGIEINVSTNITIIININFSFDYENFTRYFTEQLGIDDLMDLLRQSCSDLSRIAELLIEMSQQLKAALDILDSMSEEFRNLSAKLDEILEKLGEIYEEQVQQHEFMNTHLGAILDELKKLNLGQEEQNEMLQLIFDVLNRIGLSINNIDEHMQANFNALMDMLANGQLSLEQIIALLQSIKEDTSENCNLSRQILAAINQLGADSAASFTAILNAINQGNAQNAAGITALQTLLQSILAKINEGQEIDQNILTQIQAVLTAIANIQITGGDGGQVDLSTLETMMAELLDLVRDGNTTLLNIEDKIELVKLAIQALTAQVAADDEDILDAIRALMDKMDEFDFPEGDNVDYSQILQSILSGINENGDILAQILEAIENLELNHECDHSGIEALLELILQAVSNVVNPNDEGTLGEEDEPDGAKGGAKSGHSQNFNILDATYKIVKRPDVENTNGNNGTGDGGNTVGIDDVVDDVQTGIKEGKAKKVMVDSSNPYGLPRGVYFIQRNNNKFSIIDVNGRVCQKDISLQDINRFKQNTSDKAEW